MGTGAIGEEVLVVQDIVDESLTRHDGGDEHIWLVVVDWVRIS
jgi:hypothetical protein